MSRPIRLALAAAGLTALAGLASAQAFEPQKAHELRESHMKLMGAHLGVLGAMAKGEAEYDATTASAAADALSGLASGVDGNYWVEGSSSEEIADSRALPAIWEKMGEFEEHAASLEEAAMAMQEAAGTDLAALQGAMGALGGACGDCHKAFRKPEE
ncbi:c-type cytochrome [Limimaricola litoreus]|uniref:Cytochrome c n=1 Tax=Limimaricola litoreus TaxID=2955316 RepID=A0A9X2JR14_9RHOB|nr:cytochrome c [Limimaricola litoreus]MCP1168226.1 cytochrome c [Limimaricola litoreus]